MTRVCAEAVKKLRTVAELRVPSAVMPGLACR
jgi:hypothetical protein